MITGHTANAIRSCAKLLQIRNDLLDTTNEFEFSDVEGLNLRNAAHAIDSTVNLKLGVNDAQR